MHDIKIHVQSWKGDRAAEKGSEGSMLLAYHLLINGEEVRVRRFRARSRSGTPDVEWNLSGGTPGFMVLAVYNATKAFRDSFALDDILEPDPEQPDALLLPVRSIEFVDYAPPGV